MTPLTLLRENLVRQPLRQVLACLSLVTAFLMFMLLQSISSNFSKAGEQQDPRLLIAPKYNQAGYLLPLSHAERIRQMASVTHVSPMSFFGGYYQERRNAFGQYSIDADAFFVINKGRLQTSPEALQRMSEVRQGALVTPGLVERFGWKLGDVVPLISAYPQENGSQTWEFEIVGIYTDLNVPLPPQMLLNFEYFSEASGYNKYESTYFIALVNPQFGVPATIREIDALFENSAAPTETATREYTLGAWVRLLGNIGAMISVVLGAVFFTVLIVTGNTIAQSMRERRREFAVLRTLGFSRSFVSALLISEALALTLLAAAVGIALAFLLEPMFQNQLAGFVGRFYFQTSDVLLTFALAVATAGVLVVQPLYAMLSIPFVRALGD